MDIKHIIRTSFISLLALGMIGETLNGNIANAKHRHYHYHRVIRRHARRHHARRRHRARRRVRYVRANHVHGHGLHVGGYGYTLNDTTNDFMVHYNGGKIANSPLSSSNYSTAAIPGYRVKIIGAKHARGHLFYKIISDPTEGNNEDDGWIYSGVLGTNPRQKAHTINLSQYQPNDNTYNNNSDNSYSAPSTSSNLSHKESIAKSQTLNDINNDRASVGSSPLEESSELDQIAQMRANQIDHGAYAHKDSNGLNYYYEDAQQLGDSDVGDHSLGENIATDTSSSRLSPKKSANRMNNSMFYDEESSNGGHYQNISNPNFTRMGVGVKHAGGNTYWLAEEFGF